MRKSNIVIALLTSALLFVSLTACTAQKESTEDNLEPAVTPIEISGEVYENEATGIGIVFPPEYIGKYLIEQSDVDSFSVTHKATNELYKGKDPSYSLGWLFGIERWLISDEEAINNMNVLATPLFQTDEYAYFLRRPTGVEYDESTPEPWQTTEYKALYADEMFTKIVGSAYPLESALTSTEAFGEIYENEALGIGIVFPTEYKDKYTVQPNGNLEFTVNQKSTEKPLFQVRRFISLNPADGFSGNGQEDLLLQAGNSIYIMVRQPADNNDMNNTDAQEYAELTGDTLLNKIISGSYALESDNPAVSFGISPVYSALSRMSFPDGGMQDDFVYTLSDGCVNPALNVPLLFINGSFTAKGIGLLPDGKIEPGKPYVPVEVVVEAYGGTTNWDKTSQEMTVKIFGHEIQMKVNSNKAVFDGEEVNLQSVPIIDSDCVYIAANDDFYRYFSLNTAYLPDYEFPPFAHNPIIAIDEIGATDNLEGAAIQEIKEFVKQQLMAGLENAKKGCVGTDYESAMISVAPEIEQKINELSIYGSISKYLMMEGPYQLLVDVYTKDIYFYISGHGICFVKKADINDPYLFIPNYVGDF